MRQFWEKLQKFIYKRISHNKNCAIKIRVNTKLKFNILKMYINSTEIHNFKFKHSISHIKPLSVVMKVACLNE